MFGSECFVAFTAHLLRWVYIEAESSVLGGVVFYKLFMAKLLLTDQGTGEVRSW